MNTQHYQLRLSDLRENEGQIKAASLRRVLGALLKTTERATRFASHRRG